MRRLKGIEKLCDFEGQYRQFECRYKVSRTTVDTFQTNRDLSQEKRGVVKQPDILFRNIAKVYEPKRHSNDCHTHHVETHRIFMP